MNTRLKARFLIREAVGLAGMAVALFWPAGRLDWWPAWAALAVNAGWIAATAAIVLHFRPDLLAERLGPRKGAKSWDMAIMSSMGLVQMIRYILAGFDQRFHWTRGFPPEAQISALIICALGYSLFVWATASNAFFSQIVRIQKERNQTVVTGGPYQFIRHPGYLGAILYELAVPVLLASWWSFAFSWLGAALLVLRTALEDRTLLKELNGYADYSCRVRYRLAPGLW